MTVTPAFPGLGWPGLTWPGLDGEGGPRVTYAPPPRTLEEVLAGSGSRRYRADIVAGPAAGESLPVISGSASIEYDAPVRLSGSVTLPALPEWTALDAGAILHPLSGTEVQLVEGVIDDDGVEHWWPLGVVRPTQVSVDEQPDRVEVSCRVIDRGGVLGMARAGRAETISAGTGILAGVQDALSRLAPWLPVDLPLEDDTESRGDIALAERVGDDLWATCRAVVRSIGRLLHVDETGTVVAPVITLPQASEPTSAPLLSMSAQIDGEALVHQVSARWEEPAPEDPPEGWKPAGEEVVVTDPAAADLPENVPLHRRPYDGDESVLTSEGHALAAATARLADLLDQAVSGSCSFVPHPQARPGAIVEDGSGRRFRVTKVDIDFAGGPVAAALGNSSRTLGRRLAEVLGYGSSVRERTEIVTQVDEGSILSRMIGGEDAAPMRATRTDALAGVAVGDVIRVMHDGPGRRVATAIVGSKTIGQKFSGQTLGRVGGKDLTVDGNVDLRVRAKSGSSYSNYSSFSGGDVTVDVPAPPAPDLSAYAKKVDGWRMSGYGLSPSWPSVPSTWDSSWGANLLAQLNSVINLLNQQRQVFWNQSG